MMNLFGGIYKGTKVLITGHTGFKGSWLTMILKELGAEVLGYSLEPNTIPNIFTICNISEGIKNVIGDIRDEKKTTEVITSFNPEIIFHLAAQPLVRESYKNPKDTYEINVIGTLNVYEAARKSSALRAIVSITTDKCYENKEWDYGYREIDPLGGFDPYSSSKGCAEILSASYRRSFFQEKHVLLATARAGNVIGGGDWSQDRLIPDFIKSIVNNETLEIRSPNSIRPWQHVIEALSGYLLLGSKLLEGKKEFAEAWNFGPNDSDILTVEGILKKSINIWKKGNYKIKEEDRFHEAKLLKLDISKAKAKLKWEPKYNVLKAIEETIEWYKSYYNNEDMEKYTRNQIKSYFSEVNNLQHIPIKEICTKENSISK